MSFAEGSTTSQQPYKYNGKDWYQDEKGNVLWQEGNGNIEGYKNIGASYTMDIGEVISITYTQIDATSITTSTMTSEEWVSQYSKSYQGKTLADRACNKVSDAIDNMSTALDLGKPTKVNIDRRSGDSSADDIGDHFIVVQGKTETVKN